MQEPVNAATMVAYEDRVAIEAVLYEYCAILDSWRLDDLSSLFSEDCVYRYFFVAKGEEKVFRGREGIRDLVYEASRGVAAMSHHLSNITMTRHGDRVHTSAKIYAWHQIRNRDEQFEIWGSYRDVLVRAGSGWQIVERQSSSVGSRRVQAPSR